MPPISWQVSVATYRILEVAEPESDFWVNVPDSLFPANENALWDFPRKLRW
jgi:hypothetical protein